MRTTLYKCKSCESVFETLMPCKGGNGCLEDMTEIGEKKEDQGQEKHVPVVEKTSNGIKVKVGSIPHPMEDSHYIHWVEVIDGDIVYRKFLHPGEAPEAEFPVKSENFVVREYCNLHGLWVKE